MQEFNIYSGPTEWKWSFSLAEIVNALAGASSSTIKYNQDRNSQTINNSNKCYIKYFLGCIVCISNGWFS